MPVAQKISRRLLKGRPGEAAAVSRFGERVWGMWEGMDGELPARLCAEQRSARSILPSST
jgi:hypothetical protein